VPTVHRAHSCLLALLVASTLSPVDGAAAAPTADLRVSFEPDRLGQSTNLTFDLGILAAGSVPPPLTGVDLNYPSDLGVAISGLGLDTCSVATLEYVGPVGCAAEARMGQGSALAELPFGANIFQEGVEVAILRAPEEDGHPGFSFYAQGNSPVSLPVIFPGVLIRGSTAQTETIRIHVPLVETWPGATDVSVTQLNATLGPHGLTYYEHVHGKFIPYHPRGILLPDKCPRGGFPFSANLTFIGGSHATATSRIPCRAFSHF
jgi:hypothetical protein